MRAVRVGICAAVAVLAAVLLAEGGLPELALPIGPAGAAMRLALDPLAASFLLLAPSIASAPVALAAIAVTLSAANGFTMAIGLLMLGGIASRRPAVVAVICLILALALAGSVSDFAPIRAAPPDGWRAAAVLLLTLTGAAAVAMFSPAMALYAVLRLLFDLCGAGQPLWWGVPLVMAGAVIAAVAASRAALSDTLRDAASQAALHQFGLAVSSLGLALIARAADLPSVASHALDALWLAAVCHVLCRSLLLRGADAIASGAGTQRLDRLGGVVHRMPATAGACLTGLFTVAVLPPGLGFAAFWLAFQSLLAVARVGGFGLGILIAVATVVTGLSVGLVALAALRVAATALLGRPRTPRAAAADEAPAPVRRLLLGLAALTALLGVAPGLALLPAFGWARVAAAVSPLGLRIGFDAPGYASVFVAALVAVAWIGLSRLLRHMPAARREPAWSGGFSAPPAWMPFGDPATQYGPTSFVAPLHRVVAVLLPAAEAARQRLIRRRDVLLRAIAALVAT
jgi:formate hydrogenlyase subunit 3/multisubunit Na+/H+ antiporter MnhD subunit